MKQARDRVDDRLERITARRRDDLTVAMEDVALLCPGTDVRGPDLENERKRATIETLRLLATGVCECEGATPPVFNCASPPVIAGILARTFWLGYELGRHAE